MHVEKNPTLARLIAGISALALPWSLAQAEPLSVSGVYPSLTMRNAEGECGTGAVVPWQGSLWVITYAPHRPDGSSDKLYQVSEDLLQTIFSGSVGGTPANRMVHEESKQLLIGPYVIDQAGEIRVIPPSAMRGRLTGNARHLTDPENKVYYATMEEGLYEVDMKTLEVTCLIRDGHARSGPGIPSELPGYHGKGLFSGQGRLVYSNNGEKSAAAKKDPTTTSGALAEWFGSGDWQMVRRAQFTEVSGPGGLRGNAKPESDPLWAMGWDARSLILALLEEGQWHYYRLPKGSHSYDGAHGWNTEWPRIREIGEGDLLATMHGTFWRFPAGFSRRQSGGVAPRSNYLKVIGDFARWKDRVVFGCDDSAKAEFLNKRPFKAEHGAPLQSNSNLWFVEPDQLDHLGPAIGRGSVWLRDDVEAGQVSEPFLFDGYDHRQLHLTHQSEASVSFVLEVDVEGTDEWTTLQTLAVPSGEAISPIFAEDKRGAWVRLRSTSAAKGVTANFQYRDVDSRAPHNGSLFAGVASQTTPAATYGLMRSLAYDRLGVVASTNREGSGRRYYELNPEMELVPIDAPDKAEALISAVRQPLGAIRVDEASVVVTEDGQVYRLPKSPELAAAGEMAIEDTGAFATARLCREVATERDLLNVGGSFYELPARNAQGMAKVRPISTHNLAIHDFCSHNGLLFFTGIDAETQSEHVFRSADGQAAVWAGVVDDLWKLGKPRGIGGPWKRSKVKPNEPSDPYLMTAYDEKRVVMLTADPAKITLEVDVDGTGLWIPYREFELVGGDEPLQHTFPEGFSAYWVRAICDQETVASVTFDYR